ncbi:hypothetical protein GCM10009836_43730 [Pseudonocardia ailaonensis]|uniref:DUF2637 domain-containing protein n=1 Tax=Pseudonocardia ailaonensis TaxID=367279 RepID=A0ABN2NAG2_9PSEU
MKARAIWLPGLAVAIGAAAATAHGLYEVAVASRVPAGIAWLYPLITDGLALVAYATTARLEGSAARYAWAVVVTAAGLSGLAQAIYLASDETLEASPAVRFGIGAWPALAAAVVAHLLYLLTDSSAVQQQAEHPAVQPAPVHSEAVQPELPTGSDTSTDEQRPARGPDSPQRDRALNVARDHASAHGRLPTVSELQDHAGVSRGTAAKALRQLRDKPVDQPDDPSTPLHLVRSPRNDKSTTGTTS